MYFADCVRVSIIVIYLKVIREASLSMGLGWQTARGVGVVAKNDLQRRAQKMLNSINFIPFFMFLALFIFWFRV